MPNSVPPEFTGRFSIKRKRSTGPKRRRRTLKNPVPHMLGLSTEGSSLDRKPSLSSASSGVTPYGSPDPLEMSIKAPASPDQLAMSPAVCSDISGDAPQLPKPPTSLPIERPKPPLQIKAVEQRLALDELSESYSMLEASMSRSPTVQTHTPQNLPTPQEPGYNKYEQDTYLILHSTYHRPTSRKRQGDLDAAKALADGVMKAEDPNIYIHGIIKAMRRCAMETPKSIDYLLTAFAQATGLFPESMHTEYGRGRHAGTNRLHAWLQEEAVSFAAQLDAHDVATQDATDRSNIRIQRGHVKTDMDGVLSRVEEWKRIRTSHIITIALYGRAYALGLLRMSDGRRIEQLMSNGLSRKEKRWSKIDLIGASMLIRACGQSVHDSGDSGVLKAAGSKRDAWRAGRAGFLLQDAETWEDCFVVKGHATLGLRKLIEGLPDQTSEMLFRSSDWVF